MQQRENWLIAGEKEADGQYCLKRKAWEWKSEEYKQGFTVAVFFDKLHESAVRYEFIKNGHPIAILNKATARILGLDKVHPDDIINKSKETIKPEPKKERISEIIRYLKDDSPAHAHQALHRYLEELGYTPG